jgi:hypothetical protein
MGKNISRNPRRHDGRCAAGAAVAALLLACVALPWSGRGAFAAGDGTIQLELNKAESAQGKCRVSFVVENKGDTAIDTLKLDLAVFATDGGVRQRLAVDMGPVHAAKTMVKTFVLEDDCDQTGSILVNDVMACSPGDPSACLDHLVLSSRLPKIRFYK